MSAQKFDVNKMRVASPCPTGWENMEGDEKTRFCRLCSLKVYNISEMTAEEVRGLVANSNGRICARLYKRADGTILTRDCPVGIRAYRKRISHFAGAVFTAIIGLCSAVFGQIDTKKTDDSKDTKIVSSTQNQLNGLKGIITDMSGAVVPGAEITLQDKDNKIKLTTKSSVDGEFHFSSLPSGTYTLEIERLGFKRLIIQDIKVEGNKINELKAELELIGEVLIGVIGFTDDPEINVLNTTVKTTITKKVLDKLPF